MGLGAAVGPGLESCRSSNPCSGVTGADAVARADDHRTGKGRLGRRAATTVKAPRNGLEGQVTVFGSRRRTLVSVSPPESVAVSFSSRYDGYSWSGAVKDPLDTPAKFCTGCVWQLDGQCCMMRSHFSAEAGRVPSCASVAEPEKVRTSPTFQVVPAAGVVMVAVGAVLPTVMVTEAVSEAPTLSVTFSDAV